MNTQFAKRDYSLTGPEAQRAEDNGLVSANWYASTIPRKRLKQLMRRKDGPAIRDTVIWVVALVSTGYLAFLSWGTWWAIPAFAVYGVLYGSTSDSRWHECSHGTAFKTSWMNDLVYNIASFILFRNPIAWRWSHARHHTDTIIIGRDPEILAPRPPDIKGMMLNLFYIKGGPTGLGKIVANSFGRLSDEDKDFVPEEEWSGACMVARVHLLIHALVIFWALKIGSILPLMFVSFPIFYGAWLTVVFAITQHAGLAENVLDHRLNTRTIYMNPIFRFLYWNMNYHVEHHMFPLVPYHALPELHEEMKNDTPKPYKGLIQAYREIIPALIKQTKYPGYFVKRELPEGASLFPGSEGLETGRADYP